MKSDHLWSNREDKIRKTKGKMGKFKSGNKCENLVSKKLFYHNILE